MSDDVEPLVVLLAWLEAQPDDVQAHITFLARCLEPGWVADLGYEWDSDEGVSGLIRALRAQATTCPWSHHDAAVLAHIIDCAMSARDTPEAWARERRRNRIVAWFARRQGLRSAARVAERSAAGFHAREEEWLAAAATWRTLRRSL